MAMSPGGKLVTAEFIRVRVLWGAVCLLSLVAWYFEKLQELTWKQGTFLILSLSLLTVGEVVVLPRLQRRAGITVLLTVGELVFLGWLAWFLP